MSGHSKWSQIKRKKQIKDQKRGVIFSKLSREISLAVIQGKGITDPSHNLRLRMAIDRARQYNMPKERIDKAIEKGAGPDKDSLREVIYEGFGPEGVALVILAATDNTNRTLQSVRQVLESHGGKLASQGAVSYLFDKCALVSFNKKEASEEDVFKFSDQIEAFDIDQDEAFFYVYFPFENIGKASGLVKTVNGSAPEIDYKPRSLVKVNDKEKGEKILALLEKLEQLEDVQKVFANFDIVDQ